MDSLWDHQLLALDKLRTSARTGMRRIVLQAPPGSGKTEVAVEVTKSARAKGNSVAFTVPLLNLVDQTVSRFELRGIPAEDIGVLQARHERTKPDAPVQVISVQTLDRREVMPMVDLVIVDECHLQFKVIRKWMAERPDLTFIGLSATPWSKGMAEDWQDLQVVSTIPEMIGAGVLSHYRVFAPAQRPKIDAKGNIAGVGSYMGDYAEGQLSAVMQEKRLVADVVATWLGKGEGRPTLVFCVDRAHAAAITTQFTDVGVKAKYVDANTERDDRAAYIQGLKTGAIQVVVSIGTMTTGVDIPCVSCISYVRPTKSHILFVQSICRGLRAYSNKDHCLILDHSTTTARLGLVGDINFPVLRSGKVTKAAAAREPDIALPKECPKCGYLVPPKVYRCENCGYGAARKTDIQNEAGELVEFTRDAIDTTPSQRKANRTFMPDEKARFFGELKGYAENKGWSDGWAAHKYKSRFGVWPNAYGDTEPIWPISPETALWIRGQMAHWAMANLFRRKANA